MLKNGKLIIGLYQSDSLPVPVYICSLKQAPSIEQVNNYLSTKLSNNYGIISKNESGYKTLRILNGQTSSKYTLAFINNLLIISHDENLVLNGLQTFSNNFDTHFTSEKSFVKVKKTAGKKVDARLYVKNDKLKTITRIFLNDKFKIFMSASDSVSEWTETDVLIKNNEIILNGLAYGDNSNSIYKKIISQKPQRHKLINLMPYNTTMFVFQGFSDFDKYTGNELPKCNTLNLKRLKSLIGNETALVNTSVNKKNYFKKSFLIINFKDPEQASKIFYEAAKKSGKLKINSYGKYIINKLPEGNIAEKLFGEIYSSITGNYYSFIDDYVIIANNDYELINLLRFYETGKTLDLNENFIKLSKNLTNTSNFTLFVKLGSWLDVLTRYFSKETTSNIKLNSEILENFGAFVFQMSSQPPYIYSNIILKYNKIKYEEDLALWKVKLDDEIVKKPYPVKDHSTGKTNFIVFDKSYNVYLIRWDGTLLWKKQLDGIPESDVFQVDYYKNGKIQYLFNTTGHIYLIDRKGRYVKGYPVKISPKASNGLSVFDYNNKKDYRILLAQSDKRIYNYTLKGSKVNGWNTFKMPEIVIKPIQRLVANNKDYIIATDMNKNIKIVNRRGNERIKIKGKFEKADNSDFYVNKTNSKGILITTNQTGKLVYISSTGKLKYTDFGNFSPNHFFLYEDFNGDKSNDFIFVDDNKLLVFDKFKNVLFSYKFNHPIFIKPSFFALGRRKKALGIVVAQEKTIYLFDQNGNTIISNGLVGEIPFTVTSSNNKKDINLLTGAGSVLFNYRIK
jgi:hypothetical protein